MKHVAGCFAVVGLFGMAYGLARWTEPFETYYRIKPKGKLSKLGCAVCHIRLNGGRLNAYGKDMATAMRKAKTSEVSVSILKKIEKLDSDRDGKSNRAEILADSNPGE